MLTLYHGPTSVCSQKVRVGLAEMGLNYDGVLLDLQKGDQFAPEYMRLNPDAVVPTLLDDGLVVVESSLILEYLDREKNGGRLMPSGGAAEVAARHWLLRTLSVHAAINTLTFSTAMRDMIRATKSPEEIAAMVARMPDPVARLKRQDLLESGLESDFVGQALIHLRRTFADMAAVLEQAPWVSGEDFGLSDIALVAYVDRLDRLGFAGLWEAQPAVGTWLSAMQERPSYEAAIAAFIPSKAAEKTRKAGAAHWPRLREIWKEQ